MKKFNFKLKDLKLRRVDVHELDDRMLLVNLYLTQGLVLFIAAVIMLFQKPSLGSLFSIDNPGTILIWGGLYALIVLAADLLISRWVPPEVTDDGGINKMIFGNRALWHIALLSLIVSICEEVLFRGAIQAAWGPYWTSILFAAIHIRYLQHWLMTGLVFSISYGLGWIYIQTGTLWTPIFAHFLIDFVMGCILRYRREE
ncbi:type II CAAX prenyl endopeptidase Rce1 family protein [Paenibacillus sp. S-38]|uniref:CPBP family glutamic-type intramembrane protease n=1 Tax=Paenibacillus sp. S-38 TaxID=3416710 RepID=UPI003CEC5DE7